MNLILFENSGTDYCSVISFCLFLVSVFEK